MDTSVKLLKGAERYLRTTKRRSFTEDFKRDLFAYIEGYYNRVRLHSALGYSTPDQAERRAA